tara:strand:+ start:256 stop:390 length:135 start_codon:yes stop_codon:yes gene_type:complete
MGVGWNYTGARGYWAQERGDGKLFADGYSMLFAPSLLLLLPHPE